MIYMYLDTVYIFYCLFTSVIATTTWDNVWINCSRPDVNGTEIEAPPNATYLDNICPAGQGTLVIRCIDDKGETFHTYKKDLVNGYTVTCDPRVGILCNSDPGKNRTCPDFAMNFGCDIPDTTTAAYTAKPSQYGSSQTSYSPGINQTTLNSGQIIVMTHAGILTSSFTNSNGQTGTGTSAWRSTTPHTSNTNTPSNTSPLGGDGNQKSRTGSNVSRTTTPHPSGTNALSNTTRFGGEGNQKFGTGTSVSRTTSPYSSVTKTISDMSPIAGEGNRISGARTSMPRTTKTHPSWTNTVSKTPLVGQKYATVTYVPLMTTLRLSATKTASNTAPVGGNGKPRQKRVNENGGNGLVYDKSLFYPVCVFILYRNLFH